MKLYLSFFVTITAVSYRKNEKEQAERVVKPFVNECTRGLTTTAADGLSGTIDSEHRYRNWQHCYWNLGDPNVCEAGSIEAKINVMNIEENRHCAYDFIQYVDGGEKHERLCSILNFEDNFHFDYNDTIDYYDYHNDTATIPYYETWYQFETSNVQLNFHTDSSVIRHGFSLEWRCRGGSFPQLDSDEFKNYIIASIRKEFELVESKIETENKRARLVDVWLPALLNRWGRYIKRVFQRVYRCTVSDESDSEFTLKDLEFTFANAAQWKQNLADLVGNSKNRNCKRAGKWVDRLDELICRTKNVSVGNRNIRSNKC
jgi:hypothetical protein